MFKILAAPVRTLSAITLSMMFQVSANAIETYEITYENTTHTITKAPEGFAETAPDFDVSVYQRINPSIAHLSQDQAVDFFYSSLTGHYPNLPILFWIPHRNGLDKVQWDVRAFLKCNISPDRFVIQNGGVECIRYYLLIQEEMNSALSRKNPIDIGYAIPVKFKGTPITEPAEDDASTKLCELIKNSQTLNTLY